MLIHLRCASSTSQKVFIVFHSLDQGRDLNQMINHTRSNVQIHTAQPATLDYLNLQNKLLEF